MIKREPLPDLQQQFGQIDICLFDQLLRGQIRPGMRVLPMRLPHASVVAGKVAPALGWLQADIVFMDPPYEMEGE
jgi:16S rRNA G966 N2-methylase RsmD